MTDKYVSLEELYKLRPVNMRHVRKLRDEILAQSRATRLAEIRKASQLSQAELADLLGVDQSNISRIERGKFRSTEVGTLQAYIEALGGSLEIHARLGNQSVKLVDGESA